MSEQPPRGAEANRLTPPIVGRSAERILLNEQLGAIESGHGQLCIVSGEAGIGKTTLVRELMTEAHRRDMQVLEGHCYDLIATLPYGLWMDLSSGYAALKGPGEDVPFPPVFSPGEAPLISDQWQVFDQVRSFLTAISARQPTLIVLEDVHWADPVSLELIRHISSRLSHMRVCVVITYRADELTQQNPLYRQLPALIRESGGLRIDLTCLTRRDIDSMVEIHYPMPADDRGRLVDFLVAHSEGNPFFAVELLRSMENRGSEGGIWRAGDTWCVAELEPLVVPTLLLHVIGLRLDRLGPNVREPLALAAVIGEDVPLDLWQRIAGIDDATLMEIIEAAVQWHVVIASADGTRMRFDHALTREAIYSGILPPRRRLLHRKVAEALMALPRVDPAAVAFQLHQSCDPRTATWNILAGERAQRTYAWLTAHDQFFIAAEALADVPGQEHLRARLLYRCGRLLRYANATRGIADISLARRLAEAAGDSVLAADAEYSHGLLQCYADDWAPGVKAIEAGIVRVESMPPAHARESYSTTNWFADALPTIELSTDEGIDPAAARMADIGVSHRRGGLPWFLALAGHLDRAIVEGETFLKHVDECGSGPLVLSAAGHATFGLGIALAARGEPDLARIRFAAARELYDPLDHHAVVAFTLLTELQDVVLRYETDDLVRRGRLAEEARTAMERAGGALPADISMGRADLPLMWVDGRWDEARNVVAESSSHGNSMLRRPVTNTIPLIDYHQGKPDAVWTYIRELLPDGPDTVPGSAVLPDTLLLQSLAFNMAIDSGDIDLAKRWLRANQQWLEWSQSVAGKVEHSLDQARLNLVISRWDVASKHADRAVALSAQPRQPLARIAALRMRGVVAVASGDPAGAEADLDAALSLADACAVPLQRALTLLEIGAAMLVGSEAALNEARTIAISLHATPLLHRIERVSNHGGSAVAPESDLTIRERDVLKLAAMGLTDAEIGLQLFISHRTVSQHLRSVYAKLDIHSRAAATRFAMEHELV